MNMILKILKNQYFWLTLIIVIGLIARLYKIDNAVADWHSWRQADTAAVARNFYQEGYNPFIPKFDSMLAVSQPPIDNPERYRFVEFPIYNSIVYFVYLINGGVDEKLARLVSAVISLGSIVFIYLLTKRYFSRFTAFVASLLFAILPFNVFFSRVILPEPTLVFLCLGTLYFIDRWIFENKFWLYLLGTIFTILALLTKPMAAIYIFPLIYSYWQKEKTIWPIPKRYFLWIIPSLLPFWGWRWWIGHHPEGIPSSEWLFNGTGIRFRPAFWRWILQDRFGREILTVTGTVLFFLGLLIKPSNKEGYLLHLLALASFIYLIVFATGNVTHDYYQVIIVPALVIFTARGFTTLISGIPGFLARIWTIPFALLFMSLTVILGWNEVKGLYQINNPAIIEAGKEADRILPKDARVIAPYNGDTAFLYQVNRHGWPFVAYPIKDLINRFGATAYVSTTLDVKTKWVMRHYQVLEQQKNFVIIDLTKELKNPDDPTDPEP